MMYLQKKPNFENIAKFYLVRCDGNELLLNAHKMKIVTSISVNVEQDLL